MLRWARSGLEILSGFGCPGGFDARGSKEGAKATYFSSVDGDPIISVFRKQQVYEFFAEPLELGGDVPDLESFLKSICSFKNSPLQYNFLFVSQEENSTFLNFKISCIHEQAI